MTRLTRKTDKRASIKVEETSTMNMAKPPS